MPQNVTKGIILSAGHGTRLYPMTKSVSKQLLPVYDKPLIYYPLSILMSLNISDILIIVNEFELSRFHDLLGSGSEWGVSIQYQIQTVPKGLPDAFIIGENFIDTDNIALILGDNIYNPIDSLRKAIMQFESGAAVFGYEVADPEKYGIATLDENNNVIDIVEKPVNSKSNIAVTGFYLFDYNCVDYAYRLEPSERGELEITDLMKCYIEKGNLNLINLSHNNTAWFDCGNAEDLLKASNYIQWIEEKLSKKVGVPEEIALNNKYISKSKLSDLVSSMPQNSYREYLEKLLSIKNL